MLKITDAVRQIMPDITHEVPLHYVKVWSMVCCQCDDNNRTHPQHVCGLSGLLVHPIRCRMTIICGKTEGQRM
jgi:hypothetical protein